jgi:hypothetical protein
VIIFTQRGRLVAATVWATAASVLLNMDLCSYLTYGGVTDCPYGQQQPTFGQFFGTILQYLRKRTHMRDQVNAVFIRIARLKGLPALP